MTGKLLWTLYLKAQPGDPNRATWLNGSADSNASPSIWGMLTVDEQRGIVFVPVEKVGGNGNNDYWGGGSHGNNLYSDSVVALDAMTGKMKWFQQLVHHDIWDYDIAAAPVLVDVRRNGQVIPAVAQQTKMGLLFIFNRETGEPIFGIEERPVPQTTAPGEWTSPTQPFPVKPAPLVRNSLKRSELSKVTPEHQAFCEGLWDKYKLPDAVPYDPWRVGQDIVVLPGAQGGGNWHGAAFNKSLGFIITNVMTAPQWGHLGQGGGRGGPQAPAEPAAMGDGPPAAPAAAPQAGRGADPNAPPSMSKQTPEQTTLLAGRQAMELHRSTVGRTDRGQRQHGRHRVARAARRIRRADRQGDTAHWDAKFWWRHHDGGQPRIHRRDDRRLVPRLRRSQRQGAVEGQAPGAVAGHADDVSGTGWQAVCGYRRQRRRLLWRADRRRSNRVRAAVSSGLAGVRHASAGRPLVLFFRRNVPAGADDALGIERLLDLA